MPNNEFWRFGWPEGITEQSQDMRELWTGSVIAALIVGIAVWGLILWSVVRHRKRGDELPKQTAYNLPLEIVYTILPFLIIAGAVLLHGRRAEPGAGAQRQPGRDDRGQRVQVELAVRLPGDHGRDGEPVNTVGTSAEIPILVLPTDRTIRFEVASADVIHSFWVPEFLFKLDVIPGNENGRDNVFEVTVREEGAYVGRCAELCGTYHAYMNFEVRAVSGEDYDAYLEARESGYGHLRGARGDRPARAVATTTPFESCRTQRRPAPPVADVRQRPTLIDPTHEEARP